MSDKDKGQDPTEEPTEKRRKDYRDKGEVAQSRDLSSVGVLLALGLILAVWWEPMTVTTFEFARDMLTEGVDNPDYFVRDPTYTLRLVGVVIAKIVGPVLAVACVAGFLLAVAQVGLHWSWQSMKPDLKKMDPLEGLKSKLFSLRAIAEWLKAVLKLVIVGVVAYKLGLRYMPLLSDAAFLGMDGSAAIFGGLVARLVGYVLLAMLVLGVGDYAFAKWQLNKKMMMTKQEIKDETKEQEGDPYLKARIRRVMAEMSSNRMMADVAESTVVVTNPSHYAVALRYEMGQPSAPIVVARGVDLVAERIKEIARSKGIPRLENRPLARALYSNAKVGEEIPVDLYEAVAEVLAFVYRIRARHRPGTGLPPQYA